MKMLADESVDYQIITKLREMGFEVSSITEQSAGISDDDVLRIAQETEAFLLTEDKDFGELVFRLQKVHFGILLIRLSGLASDEKTKITTSAFQKEASNMQKAFCVLTEDRLRIRR
jgi:predicted nuclease of predicted toxin-antitoxin system